MYYCCCFHFDVHLCTYIFRYENKASLPCERTLDFRFRRKNEPTNEQKRRKNDVKLNIHNLIISISFFVCVNGQSSLSIIMNYPELGLNLNCKINGKNKNMEMPTMNDQQNELKCCFFSSDFYFTVKNPSENLSNPMTDTIKTHFK